MTNVRSLGPSSGYQDSSYLDSWRILEFLNDSEYMEVTQGIYSFAKQILNKQSAKKRSKRKSLQLTE